MEWINDPFALSEKFDGYVFDIYGVLHNGLTAYPVTYHWLDHLQQSGKHVAFISNSPLSPQGVKTHLSQYHINPTLYDLMLTAGEETRIYLATFPETTCCYFIGDDEMKRSIIPPHINVCSHLKEANLIVFAGVAPGVKTVHAYDVLFKEALSRALHLVCANPDEYVFEGENLRLRPGAFAKRYEEMGGSASYHGKPHPSIYMRLLSQWPNIAHDRILCIGDSLLTDLEGARHQKLCSLWMIGHLSLLELDLKADPLSGKKTMREKISAQLTKGPYNPTYGFLMS